ncbi:MAG: hypothetical protein AB7T49_16915 [Oligoflexales bacterium]
MKKYALTLFMVLTALAACKPDRKQRVKSASDGTGAEIDPMGSEDAVSEEDTVLNKDGVFYILEKTDLKCQVVVEGKDETVYDVTEIKISQDKAFINVKFSWVASGIQQDIGSIVPEIVGIFSEKLKKLSAILVDKTLLNKASEDVKIDKAFTGEKKTKIAGILKDEKIMSLELGEFFDEAVAPKFTGKKTIRTCRQ